MWVKWLIGRFMLISIKDLFIDDDVVILWIRIRYANGILDRSAMIVREPC